MFDDLRYDPETGHFWWIRKGNSNRRPLHKPAGWYSSGYVVIDYEGARYKAHNLAWFFVYGEWPSGLLDHINLKRDDNRIENLRIATASQNSANTKMRAINKVGLKGVTQAYKNRFEARIKVNGKIHFLGYFHTATEAHAAYCKAAQEFHGHFART